MKRCSRGSDGRFRKELAVVAPSSDNTARIWNAESGTEIAVLEGLALALSALMLLFEEVAKTGRVPFRYYAMMVGLISGGLGLIGIGQGLRLLLLILGKE
jgi:hypothetical protein